MQTSTTLRQRSDGFAQTSDMRQGPDKYQSVWKASTGSNLGELADKATRQRVFARDGAYAVSHRRRSVVNRLWPKVGAGHRILANFPGQLRVV
jgi:hypothetical protein